MLKYTKKVTYYLARLIFDNLKIIIQEITAPTT